MTDKPTFLELAVAINPDCEGDWHIEQICNQLQYYIDNDLKIPELSLYPTKVPIKKSKIVGNGKNFTIEDDLND